MPITPFMGVRISWLTFARKLLLARLAASAASLASSAACSANLRSVIELHRAREPDGLAVRIALGLGAQAHPFVVPGLVPHADLDVEDACRRSRLILDRLLRRRRGPPDESCSRSARRECASSPVAKPSSSSKRGPNQSLFGRDVEFPHAVARAAHGPGQALFGRVRAPPRCASSP